MNKGTQTKFLALSLFVFLAACTKPRSVEVRDENLQNSLFAIAELQGKSYEVKTGDLAPNELVSSSAENEKPMTKVVSTTAPRRLQKIFQSISINAQRNSNYQVKLTVDREYLNVFKIVDQNEDLSLIEKHLSIKEKGKIIVPLFKIAIQDKGILVRAKNENKEQTSTLILKSTDFEEATHIVISTKTEAALRIGANANQKDELAQVFLENRLSNKVTSLSDLVSSLKIALSPINDGLVATRTEVLGGGRANLFVFRLVKLSEIKDEVLLAKLKSVSSSKEIANCPTEILQQLKDEDLKKQCVMVLAYRVAGSNVRPELAKSSIAGVLTSDLTIKPEISNRSTGLIRIAEATAAEPVGKEALENLNPYNTIRITDIKNKEFLLRRTFEDGASSIMVFGPGASGDLDIVKFELLKDRLVVRRAVAINGDKKPTSIDREELMSIPARYLKRDLSDSSINYKLSEATHLDAEYVSLSWANNSIPVVNSPLAFFDAGQCFLSVGSQDVKDMDNRIHEGVLNFSIEGTYTFTPDCMSWYGMNDYWYGGNLQGAFNIKERVSFKLHDQKQDGNPAKEIPFRAQTLLNYGVFTAGKLNPDKFGNTMSVGSEKALPVVHDFSKGKQLVYVLGGLPNEGEIRQALIDGTREVIEDWNKSLSKAFEGTDLARNLAKDPAYIVLKIDGEDLPLGRLGDLDRNYIWNFEKNLDSGLLGMSQAGPNPRSGRIEQNNVLMYSGNLMSSIGHMKEFARITKEYESIKNQAMAQLMAKGIEAEAAEGSVSKKDENLLDIVEGAPGLSDDQKKKLIEISRRFNRKMDKASQNLSAKKSSLNVTPRIGAANRNFIKSEIKKFGKESNDSIARKNLTTAKLSKQTFLRQILQKALEDKSTKDPLALQAISAAEVLKAYSHVLTPAQREALALQSRRLALMAEFSKSFHKGPNCAMTAQLAADSNSRILDEPVEVVFKNFYKTTLAHEIGHSLGLTHNFMGSFDKANFANKNESNGRNYSSIMDYIPDDKINYQGPGPYDVRALRVSYTGLVELHPELAKFKRGTKVQIPNMQTGEVVAEIRVNDRLEATLEDYKQVVLGSESWWKLDASKMAKMPLKSYGFCTDIHVGSEPSCNRWDIGTSLTEIAQFYSKEYSNAYPVSNHIGNRTNIRGMGSYIGRLFYQMFNMRFFMDEAFYRAMAGYPQEYIADAAYGAVTSWMTLNQVIGTPSTTASFYSPERFFLHKYQYAETDEKGNPIVDKEGKPIVKEASVMVEAKAVQDIQLPGHADLIETRGIEFDKAIAMMMLTERSWGHPRYESVGLRVSYAEFEKYLLGLEANSSLVLANLTSILADTPISFVSTPHGVQFLPVQPTTTEVIRYYSILSSTIMLHSDATEDKYNFASLFRVGNSIRSAPNDRILLTKLDQNVNSPTSLKLWAFDNASLSGQLVKQAAKSRVLLESNEQLGLLTAKLVEAVVANNTDAIKANVDKTGKALLELNKNEVLFTAEGLNSGELQKSLITAVQTTIAQEQMLDELVNEMGPMILQFLPGVGAQIAEQLNSTSIEPAVALSIGAMKAKYVGEIQDFTPPQNWESIKDTAEGKKLILDYTRKTAGQIWAQNLLSIDNLSSKHGVIFSNLETMNQIFGVMGYRNSNE